MKKLLSLFLVIALCFLLTACVDVYSSVDDYQIIYDNVEKANKTFTKSGKKETLLEFDEYAYCSYLLLFPRQTPEKLTNFEYSWYQLIDYDNYYIFFTYELDETEFGEFEQSLSEFSISYKDQTNKPVYTETLFEYPTYILSWTDEVENGGTCEFIMLDESTHTVINVYKLGYDFETCQGKAEYNITPVDNNFDAVEQLCGYEEFCVGSKCGFTVYSFSDENNGWFAPKMDELVYDNKFLNLV